MTGGYQLTNQFSFPYEENENGFCLVVSLWEKGVLNFPTAESIIYYWVFMLQHLTQNICSTRSIWCSGAVNSLKVSIFRRLRAQQSHSRGKPYTFSAPDSNKNSQRFWRERTSASGRPANHSLRTVRFSGSSPVIGQRRLLGPPPPAADWLVFPAPWKSFEYASL